MAARGPGHARRYPVSCRALAGFIMASAAFAAIFVALTLSAFHAPRPHDLPVGVVGTAGVISRVEHRVDTAAPGAFGWRSYASQAGARTAIEHRAVYGALIASGRDLRLLVTEGGGSGPAQVLTRTFAAAAAGSGHSLVVADVVPPRPGDTQALSSFFVVLGVLIPSVVAGSGSALAFRRARGVLAVTAPVAVAVVIGAVSAAVADGIAGLGSYAGIAGVVALFSLAVAAPTAVLARIWPPLVAVAVLAFIVVGIPVSGGPANLASFGPAFLRAADPVLPLGVAAATVRNVVYFGGHGTAWDLWVLAAWALTGVAGLLAVTAMRRRAPALSGPGWRPAVTGAPTVPPAPGVPAVAGVPRFPDTAAGRPGVPVTLVVGFDNSGPARRALTWGANLLRTRPGTLHIVYADHVVIDSDLSGFAHSEMADARDEKAAGVAEAAAQIAAAAGVPHEFERRQESPADAILSAASSHDAAGPTGTPVIVTGRSRHAVHHIIGSVPVQLLHQARYPVFTIP